ncbi:MAG: EFR1 family ferrodoxin [Clostridiales bacterium]|nr:EFR1 family ferrodoxin [Clostridiales bacterium]
MSKNIIFVFSGTGNCLWVAKEVAEKIGDCEIVSMGKKGGYSLEVGYDRIGFVAPTYWRGVPTCVKSFIKQLNLSENKNSYYFTIATAGTTSTTGNTVMQIRKMLKLKGIMLEYTDRIGIVSNYIVGANMKEDVKKEVKQADHDLKQVIKMVTGKSSNKKDTMTEPIQQLAYDLIMPFVPKQDKNFNVSDACISCGICEKICPVENITLDNVGKPTFNHHCEQCVACIQNCPTQAINYKNKTQNRRRYRHPGISVNDLIELNSSK